MGKFVHKVIWGCVGVIQLPLRLKYLIGKVYFDERNNYISTMGEGNL